MSAPVPHEYTMEDIEQIRVDIHKFHNLCLLFDPKYAAHYKELTSKKRLTQIKIKRHVRAYRRAQ